MTGSMEKGESNSTSRISQGSEKWSTYDHWMLWPSSTREVSASIRAETEPELQSWSLALRRMGCTSFWTSTLNAERMLRHKRRSSDSCGATESERPSLSEQGSRSCSS